MQMTCFKKEEETEETDNCELLISYCYPKNFQMKTARAQVAILKEADIFSKMDFSEARKAARGILLPKKAEGFAVIPKFTLVSDLYFEALKIMLDALKRKINCFYDFLSYKIDYERLAFDTRTKNVLQRIFTNERTNFICLPIQLGKAYKASLTHGTVISCLAKGEFLLDAFSLACIFYCHPEMILSHRHLGIECFGTKIADEKETRRFSSNVFFHCNEFGNLIVGTKKDYIPYPGYYVATGFAV